MSKQEKGILGKKHSTETAWLVKRHDKVLDESRIVPHRWR